MRHAAKPDGLFILREILYSNQGDFQGKLPEKPHMMVQRIRNIGIIAHIDAGKTTTSERILYYTGKTHRMGEVDNGEATMDWMDQEQERGITITAAVTTCFWRDHQINIIDTPGHVDFTAEVERSLRVLDGAVAIFDAVGGVEPQSETVWHQADRYHVPKISYVNKMDRVGADFPGVLEEMVSKLATVPLPLQLPIGKEAEFEGVIDLLEMREIRFSPEDQGATMSVSPIHPDREAQARVWREKLLDALGSLSDELTELYLKGQAIGAELLRKLVRQGTLGGHFTPVFCGASLRNMGVQPVLDAVVDFLPSPPDVPPVKGHHSKKNEEIDVPCKPDAFPLALLFKLQANREAGNLCYIRMYSGRFKEGQIVYNVNKKKRERINRLLRMHANHPEQIPHVEAGDIAVVIGLKTSQTGDTLGVEGFPILLEKMHFPEPVISVAIEPKTLSERKKLFDVLDTLSLEDPTFSVKENEETGELIISGMGELHLDVLVTRMLREFKVEARVGKPQVSYRESITKIVTHVEKYHRMIAGKEHSAQITIRVEPLPRGAGNSFTNGIKGGELPEDLIDAVERGVTAAFGSGVVYGYPAFDMGVTLVEAEFHQTTSTPIAFEAAGAMAFDAACRKADPILLEPIMAVNILTPTEFVGDVIGNLNARSGLIVHVESKPGHDHVKAQAPLVAMFGYSTSLRSITQGRGTFTMEFSHFAEKVGGFGDGS
jgi:elongation factor G